MKFFFAVLVIFVVENCNGQTNPVAWGREQRDQRSRLQNTEAVNEVLINTDRLESRLSNLIRSENNGLRQQITRLEQANARLEAAISTLKSDVVGIKETLTTALGEKNLTQSILELPSLPSTHDEKLDKLSSSLNSIRESTMRLERDATIVRKGVRALNTARHNNQVTLQGQPQFAMIQSPGEERAHYGVCSSNDQSESGIRKIRKNFLAYCETRYDDGGWIVIQNRVDGTTDFFRSWNEYKEGFGNIAGEFWMGLEKIHELTSSKIFALLIVMENHAGETKYARYSSFGISGESSGYALSLLGRFIGDAGDSLSYHAGMRFSTYDTDNDGWDGGNCAKSHLGGWWYNSCDQSNLNGHYFKEDTMEDKNNYQGIYWKSFGGSMNSLKHVKMMIRPADI